MQLSQRDLRAIEREKERKKLEASTQDNNTGIGGRGKKKMEEQNNEFKAFMEKQDQVNQTLLQMIQTLTTTINNKFRPNNEDEGNLEQSGGGHHSRTSKGSTHRPS